jgi:hypothetical protein
MSMMAVPKDIQTVTESKLTPPDKSDSSLSESLHSESDSDMSEVSVKKHVSEMKNSNVFLTKIAGLMVFYNLCLLAMSIFIITDLIRAKMLYRSMDLKSTVWVFFVLALIIKMIGSFGNKYLGKVMGLLFILDCVFSAFAFFGFYWFFETVSADSYEYNGHYVIICGFCLLSTSFGFLFSTLIKLKKTPYSALAGIIMMSIFNIIALAIIKGIWKIHNMRFYKYFLIWMWFLFLNIYIAINSKYLLEKRADRFLEKETVHAFFTYSTDWFSFFWIDLFTSFKSKKKNKKKKNKKKRKPKSVSSESIEMESSDK